MNLESSGLGFVAVCPFIFDDHSNDCKSRKLRTYIFRYSVRRSRIGFDETAILFVFLMMFMFSDMFNSYNTAAAAL